MKDRETEAEEARRSLAALSGEAQRGAAPEDAVELWAKRIGRFLGLVFLGLLAVNLLTGWFF